MDVGRGGGGRKKGEGEEESRKEDEGGGVSVSMDAEGGKDPLSNGLSSVIPGWFSEISAMWPG